MAERDSSSDSTLATTPDETASLVRAGLDTLPFGFAIFDRELRLVASNKAFRTLRGYPAALCRPGTGIIEFYRFNAARGDYGAGDVEIHARSRLDRVRTRDAHELEYKTASGQILSVAYVPIARKGLVWTYADITARRLAEEQVAQKEAQLKVALDNMPGALAYTDANLNIAVCNDRFADMYPVPRELLLPGHLLSRIPALSGRTRLLRRRRRRQPGRSARGKPAQSVGQDIRGPDA